MRVVYAVTEVVAMMICFVIIILLLLGQIGGFLTAPLQSFATGVDILWISLGLVLVINISRFLRRRCSS
ncbi:hypothetical protein A3D70_01440 [Candidatus Adlerbacteria bacterium RIFCSPHIGHO2_02_FULL_54_18]|uniref:Uncharacterized protein n=2 Tax=Parcubacteria group TaxID=1794811 RepID=A0A1F4Y3W1_9BACT|nr:MAG: hypothetical protein A3D70_01440 [Candidatus Adlerbacteria bacterium RIFCSPHIGHO2_02_FULL_54_18]OGG77319.1 MAG: hypothetical protein A3B35_01655 [Candidatus Kaiserbacteria bacterium RIFCSPLOWO2_01_FULL_54_24]